MRFHEWLWSLFSGRENESLRPEAEPEQMDGLMRMSADGRRTLTVREGRRLTAYRDTKGIDTIGVGHTAAAGEPIPVPGMRISSAECDQIFARDLVQYENTVRSAVNVPLSQGEFDALVSLCFNIGQGAFRGSSAVRKLNTGDREGAAKAILLWNRPREILSRRQGEYRQFAEAAGIPKERWIA